MKKKNILFIVFVFGTLNSLLAQWSIGFQGGFNSSKNDVKGRVSGVNVSYKTGLVIGGLVNYRLNNLFSLQFEPRYNVKGEAVQLYTDSVDSDLKMHFNFIELPLFLVAEQKYDQFTPFIVGGVSLGLLIKASVDSRVGSVEETVDITDHFSSTDLALEIGGGIKYNVRSSINLLVSFRYSHGIKDISDFGWDEDEGYVKTRGLHLLFGVMYDL